ncbi:MAG: hypothetical protein H3C43_00295 [Leptonema sp. (in: Bacteria)]|nr:hypothetical protein [Leptonema sp. (in: bacteria)]
MGQAQSRLSAKPNRTLDSLYQDRYGSLIVDTVETALNKLGLISPIIICGPAGTGKTHLLQGIEAESTGLNYSISFISLSLWIENNGSQVTELSDILLIDGLHHIANLDETATDHFFTIFDQYFDRQKQIFVSTEVDIKDLNLADRWQSRLRSGLSFELKLPDPEDRIGFLQNRLIEFEIQATREWLTQLSIPEHLSYRDLESVAAMIFLYSRNNWNDDRLIKDLQSKFPLPKKSDTQLIFSIEHIVSTVIDHFSVTKADLISKSRRAEHTLPRHIAMTLAQKYTGLNKSSIARYFQRSDHSVVIHAISKISQKLKADPGFRSIYSRILQSLNKQRL